MDVVKLFPVIIYSTATRSRFLFFHPIIKSEDSKVRMGKLRISC